MNRKLQSAGFCAGAILLLFCFSCSHGFQASLQQPPRRPLSTLSMSTRTDAPSSRTWAQSPTRKLTQPAPFSTTHNSPPPPSSSTSMSSKQSTPRPRRKSKPLPVTGYDAKAIDELYDRRPLQVGWRLNSLGFPLLGWYLGLLMDKTMGVYDHEYMQRKRGEELRMHLVNSKSVALIKSGQALSLRPDLIKNKIWAEELGKLVDAVGSFSDKEAMRIMKRELTDLYPRLEVTKEIWQGKRKNKKDRRLNKVEKFVEKDPALSLFEFYNDNKAVASASIGQVYKAKIRRGPQLEAAIGREQAQIWGGKTVAIKVQRPDVEASASLDMYLLRKTAIWLSKFRGGDMPAIADQFGMQLFAELDYIREADNCERFRELYGGWDDVVVPASCRALTRKRVLVQEWIEGEKGPWKGQKGIDMVSVGLRCSVDQLMTTGIFHADPHRGNMLRTTDGKLALIDFGMMADIDEEERYGLFGLVIGLQNKDLSLVTENLLKLGFLEDTTQLNLLIPRLRAALLNATGGTGKASDVNFAQLQAELDKISRENVLRFSLPPFFTVIIRSLTILEGVALAVDPNFRLVRGAYPYVLRQLLNPDGTEETPPALTKLLTRILTVNGEGREIEWETLRDFLKLAQKASKKYDPSEEEPDDNKTQLSRRTIEMFFDFLTSRTGLFLKEPLVHELAEAIDGLASMGEANLLRTTGGLLPALPGMNGPINTRRMDEIRVFLETFENALVVNGNSNVAATIDNNRANGGRLLPGGGPLANVRPPIQIEQSRARLEAMIEFFREISVHLGDERLRKDSEELITELQSVIRMVAAEVLEIRTSRAMRSILRVGGS